MNNRIKVLFFILVIFVIVIITACFKTVPEGKPNPTLKPDIYPPKVRIREPQLNIVYKDKIVYKNTEKIVYKDKVVLKKIPVYP